VEPYLLEFKKPVKADSMSEQAIALKTTVKGKGKTSPLEGLLKAGAIDAKDNKEFVKKLIEMTKKGEIELDKNGSLKLKTTQKAETQVVDESAFMHIKQLFSQVKLNDRLAIEKSVKELRNATDKTKDAKDSKEGAKDVKDLKKLLDIAKDSGVEVKKISVETLKTEAPKEKEVDTKKTVQTPSKIVDKKIVAELAKESQKAEPEVKGKPAKEVLKEAVAAEAKKEAPSLAALLQGGVKIKEEKEVLSKDAQQNTKIKEAKKEADVKIAAKTGESVVAAFKEPLASEKSKNEAWELSDFLAKKDAQKEELAHHRKETHVNTSLLEAPKQSDNELKGKMAVASEGLKNFSSDLKETIDNYKPPLMKVSMEMNPQNLGSVDVTLITRGSNLIVNVSSTQDTMQMFMQNIGEFKANLMAQGFVSLQMNFNFSENNKEQNNKNFQKEAAKKYQVNGDMTTKSIESLDIIMPHPKYA
jgi:flagellar hook-length control protein FliK